MFMYACVMCIYTRVYIYEKIGLYTYTFYMYILNIHYVSVCCVYICMCVCVCVYSDILNIHIIYSMFIYGVYTHIYTNILYLH